MPKYKITIEYDGTNLVGWQKQPNQASIQSILEDAIFYLSQEHVDLTAAGRTDAGVHALGQVAHFELKKDFTENNIRQGINFHIKNKSVAVVAVEKVLADFSARFSAKKRYYKYAILNRSSVPALDRNRVWHVPQELDINAMKKAAKYFKGNHDFTSFRATECQAKSPVKTLDKIKIEQVGEYIYLYFSAKSFLHHMVRNMTGTLVEVGLGRKNPKDIPQILKAKDRAKAGQTAPACGLYFVKVDY